MENKTPLSWEVEEKKRKKKLSFKLYRKYEYSSCTMLFLTVLIFIYVVYDVIKIFTEGIKWGFNIIGLVAGIGFLFLFLLSKIYPNSIFSKKKPLVGSLWLIITIVALTLLFLLNYKTINTEEVYVEVLSPNGGEEWVIGEENIVRWKTENLPSDTRLLIRIRRDDDGIIGIASDISPQTNEYKWQIDLNELLCWSWGASCIELNAEEILEHEFKIEAVAYWANPQDDRYYVTKVDASDNYFSIIKEDEATQMPYIKVIYPDGGEQWMVGESYQIQWQSNNVKEVSITMMPVITSNESRIIVDSITNTGSYLWQIPQDFPKGDYLMNLYAIPEKGNFRPVSDASDGSLNISFK